LIPSVNIDTKVDNVKVLEDRLSYLNGVLSNFADEKIKLEGRMEVMHKQIVDLDTQMEEISDQISCIKNNWDIIVNDKDPLFRSKIIFRRFHVKCNICGLTTITKKDLKVHIFKEHSY